MQIGSANRTQIHGHVAKGFEPVLQAFQANFARREEVGAAVAITKDGERVVDLWAGYADRGAKRAWEADTPVVAWSSTKGLAAMCFLMLADRGQLDYDRLVADYWPGFACEGKESITVRTLMNHRSGLSALRTPIAIEDFADMGKVRAVCEAESPLWRPGRFQGYGAVAWGAYAQALFHSITKETLGAFLAREIAGPLGADLYLGVPDTVLPRLATIYPVSGSEALRRVVPTVLFGSTENGKKFRRAAFAPRSITYHVLRGYPKFSGGLHAMNRGAVRRLELPWCNGHMSARGLAAAYDVFARGGSIPNPNAASGMLTLCRPETLAPIHRVQSWGQPDLVLNKPLGYSQGFTKDQPHIISPNREAFGHTGMGGSVGFADPVHRIGFGYVMNKMDFRIRSPRMIALCRALYRSLGSR